MKLVSDQSMAPWLTPNNCEQCLFSISIKCPATRGLAPALDSERTDNRNREMDTTQPGQEICAVSGFVFNPLSNN